MVQHAIHARDKQARRAAILAAARALFLRSPDRLPSAALIADAAGLAKGTAYLYFRTKEEIFMALLQEEWAGTFALVHGVFRAGKRSGPRQVARFLRGYLAYVQTHPELLRLEALRYSVLERNLTPARRGAFKQEASAALRQAGQAVDTALGLLPGRGVRLLLHSYALTLGLWQALDGPEAGRKPAADRGLDTLRLDFRTELRASLEQHWRGWETVDGPGRRKTQV